MSIDPLVELEYRCWYLAENVDRPRLTRLKKQELREEAEAAGRAVEAVRAELRHITDEVQAMGRLIDRIAVAAGVLPEPRLSLVTKEVATDA